MLRWFRSLDQILRGELTRPDQIRDGHIELPRTGLVAVAILLAMVYGACMGSYSLFKQVAPGLGDPSDRYLQILASSVKVPALFLLTLLITFPSLYVFNTLVGSRLKFHSVLNLLIAALAVNLAVLASMGPIVAFFSVSTTSYPFMKLLNVAVMGFAGLLGLAFLMQTLNRMSQPTNAFIESGRPDARPAPDETVPEEGSKDEDEDKVTHESEPDEQTADELMASLASSEAETPQAPGALDPVEEHVLGRHVATVFRIWVIVFGLVGAQMGWVLRPFLGNPDQEFTWFRARESNFFEALAQAIMGMFGGG